MNLAYLLLLLSASGTAHAGTAFEARRGVPMNRMQLDPDPPRRARTATEPTAEVTRAAEDSSREQEEAAWPLGVLPFRRGKKSGRRVRKDVDRVVLSPHTSLVNDALRAAEKTPEIRPQLVERMHRLLAAGELGRDVERLADSLLDHLESSTLTDLSGRSRRRRPGKVLPLFR